MKALISVYNKENIEIIVTELVKRQYKILASGNTYKTIVKLGYDCIKVEDYTKTPEMLGGRVKTLNPMVHGGILYRRDNEDDKKEVEKYNISNIDVVVCNLYPFYEASKNNYTLEEMVEYIDIGGPAMIRACAKNFKYTTVITDPKDYEEFINEENNLEYRKKQAIKAFKLCSEYDKNIYQYLEEKKEVLDSYKYISDLKYGENPHQKAKYYSNGNGFMSDFTLLNGKKLGYINYLDIDNAYFTASLFDEVACVGVKHATACSIALGKDVYDAYTKAYNSDKVSIFGGCVAFNSEVDLITSKKLNEIMLHIVVAPSFTEAALEELRKKKNLIVIKMNTSPTDTYTMHSVDGGLLVQQKDYYKDEEFIVVTKKEPTKEEIEEMKFAQKAVMSIKSNGIVVSSNRVCVGIGGGFVNRIDALKYALEKADKPLVLASDAFFPFDDIVTLANEYNIKAIIQPGGSINDQKSIDKCDELGISMVFTNVRHFRH